MIGRVVEDVERGEGSCRFFFFRGEGKAECCCHFIDDCSVQVWGSLLLAIRGNLIVGFRIEIEWKNLWSPFIAHKIYL
ncbi:MAG: hypothetical protein WCL46_01500 [Chlorobium sp.]